MKKDIEIIKNVAEDARILYRLNLISREEAKVLINPYLKEVNKKAIELAKIYNTKPFKSNFITYCR